MSPQSVCEEEKEDDDQPYRWQPSLQTQVSEALSRLQFRRLNPEQHAAISAFHSRITEIRARRVQEIEAHQLDMYYAEFDEQEQFVEYMVAMQMRERVLMAHYELQMNIVIRCLLSYIHSIEAEDNRDSDDE